MVTFFRKFFNVLVIACLMVIARPSDAMAGNIISYPSGTVEGRLANGLHYIILPNDLPRHNVECRLVMHVGSIQEEDDEKGVAHFLEHMVFDDTEHFPNDGLIDYCERQGMKYGRDINAFTGFERTIYWFSLPIDKFTGDIVDSTIVAVGDILHHINIDSKRVHKERGIIIEELRGYNTNDAFYSLKNGHGCYAEHLPLGRDVDINTMEADKLMAFHDKWYVPERASLLIVGNVDAKATEAKIMSHLAAIPARRAPWTFRSHEYPKGIQMMTLNSSYGKRQKLELMIPHQMIAKKTVDDFVMAERLRMVVKMMSYRLDEAHVMVSDHWYLADKNHLVFSFDGNDVDALRKKIILSAATLRMFAEGKCEKAELMWAINQSVARLKAEPTNKFSADMCEDFIDGIIVGDRHLYSDDDVYLIAEQLNKTTSKDIRKIASQLLKAANRTILVACQCPKGDESLTEDEVLKCWNSGLASMAPVFVPETSSHDDEEESIEVVEILAAHHENKDYLAEKKYYGELGVTEILLKNGIHVIMRPTIDEEAKIHISALGRGGLGDLPDSLYMHLKDAVGYVDMGGISTIDADTLGMIMGQRELMLNIGMDNYWHESLVTSSTADAQILMNLLYEKLHHPGTAYTDFEECKKQELDSYGKETALEMQLSNDPGRMLNACVDSLFGNIVGAHFLPHSRKDIEAMNLDDMTNYYRQVFTDPDGLYLIITGNFDVDSIGAMAVSTFGRMTRPAVPFVRRMDKEQVPNAFTGRFGGLEPSMTCCNLIFPGNYHPGLRQSLMFKLMRDILQARLISVMRQRDNIVYSPFANVFYNGEPQQIMWFRLYIDVKNENFDKMMADMMEIVGELSSKPVSEAELQKMKRSFIVTKRQALNDVSTSEWKNAIAGLIRNGESLSDFNNYDEVLEAITPKMLQEAFAKYVKMENLILLYQKE